LNFGSENGVAFTRAALALLGDAQRHVAMDAATREWVIGFAWDDLVRRFDSVRVQAIECQAEGRYAACSVLSG